MLLFFNCKDFVLVWYYMLYVQYSGRNHLVSSCFLSEQHVQDFALHKVHNLKFQKRKGRCEDWTAGRMEEGVGEERCFMKGRCVLLIDFLSLIYLVLISIFNFLSRFTIQYFLKIFLKFNFASLFSRSSQFFMMVSFASSKSCTFYVQIFCPSFSMG